MRGHFQKWIPVNCRPYALTKCSNVPWSSPLILTAVASGLSAIGSRSFAVAFPPPISGRTRVSIQGRGPICERRSISLEGCNSRTPPNLAENGPHQTVVPQSSLSAWCWRHGLATGECSLITLTRLPGRRYKACMGSALRRYWFDFDLPAREVRPDGRVTLDHRPVEYLRNGIGVTGYDEEDCLRLIEEQVMRGEPVPPVRSVVADVDVRAIPEFFQKHAQIGVPVWRGVWAPPFNRTGPAVERG
jgi:hypothetical protein